MVVFDNLTYFILVFWKDLLTFLLIIVRSPAQIDIF